MTQEEKDLLLKDLCARLPYEVILLAPNRKVTYQTDGNTSAELLIEEGWKPYLRPISSMTEKEVNEFEQITDNLLDNGTSEEIWSTVFDWLNAHHFDYRGLIPMGLAIEVTPENNPYKDVKD